MELPRGLEGVEVDESAISLVDGERGQLSYRGIGIDTLVQWPFTRVVYLVLTGTDPDARTLARFGAELARAGTLSKGDRECVELVARLPIHPMQALISLTPMLSHDDQAFAEFADAAHGVSIAARLPNAIALLLALRRGATMTDATGTADPNAGFLTAIGCAADARLRNAFTVTQILQIEHSFNASTFAARVIASTLAPVENALAGAFAALHGRLHGGADEAALAMAREVGTVAASAAYVDGCLERGIKIMGMGHREYRVLDPRARYVKAFARELSAGTELEVTTATLEAIESRFSERMREKGRHLYANLEFYKGVVYAAAGLPADFFTPTFAMARVYGYLAHFIESRKDNRLIRPAARYVGKRPSVTPA